MYQFHSFYLDAPIIPGRAFDVFMPEKVTQKTALFFVHGGGWTGGAKENYHKIMYAYCSRGYVCASAGYRLLQTNCKNTLSAVDQLGDVQECYDGFVTFLKERHLEPQIAVFGTSAGAHLASLLICAQPGDCGEKCTLANSWITPFCGLLQSTPASFEPWPESYPAMWGMMERAAGGKYQEEPEKFRNISLCRFINEKNPPLFFMEAGGEELFPKHYNEAFLARHQAWQIPSKMKFYRYAEHGFFYDLTRPCQQEAFEDIIAFIRELEN